MITICITIVLVVAIICTTIYGIYYLHLYTYADEDNNSKTKLEDIAYICENELQTEAIRTKGDENSYYDYRVYKEAMMLIRDMIYNYLNTEKKQ